MIFTINAEKAIFLACELIRRAAKHRFIPDYLLADTWFTCSELINKVRKLGRGGIHFPGIMKNGRRKFEYEGKTFGDDGMGTFVCSLLSLKQNKLPSI